MKIIDLNGCAIEVTDLDGAIRKVKEFKGYSHVPPNPMDSRLLQYWTDMHEKLTVLREHLNADDHEDH